MSLEPISLGQGRTNCPGLVADERGVVMGRRLALLFPTVAQVVGFFRSYSREASIDELAGSLEIVDVTSPVGAQEAMVRFEVPSSYAADKAASMGRQHRGRVFTGTEAHYVPYRDKRAPLGYDVSNVDALRQHATSLILHTDAGADPRSIIRTHSLPRMLLQLRVRALTSAEQATEQHPALVLRVEPGLSSSICRYLWARQIRATVSTAVLASTTRFGGRAREVELVRCEGMPHHAVSLMKKTPGVRVFVPTDAHLLVEHGYRHPISLDSCARCFPPEQTVLFGGDGKAEVVSTPNHGVDIRDLVEVEVEARGVELKPAKPVDSVGLDALGVSLTLSRLPRASPSTTALLIPLDRLRWFTRLIYLLPAAVLRSYDACLTDQSIIVVNRAGVHGIPFGLPMTELHPQLFVPVGFGLLPRVDHELLREHLQLDASRLTFFPDEQPAFSIDAAAIQPLSRAIVAPERARERLVQVAMQDPLAELGAPRVQHKKPGAFSLWRGTKNLDKPASATLEPGQAPKQLPRPDHT
jgi:hypothetical protein